MLKTGLILGLMAPLLFRSRDMAPSNDIEPVMPPLPPMPELAMPPLAPMETVAVTEVSDDLPWPELPEMKSPEAAVAEVLAELVEYHGAGASIRFSHIASYYRLFAARRAWPIIADKTFSQMLCALGCEREQRDLRATEGKRPTFITLMPAQAIDEDEISEFIEPMRLAA